MSFKNYIEWGPDFKEKMKETRARLGENPEIISSKKMRKLPVKHYGENIYILVNPHRDYITKSGNDFRGVIFLRNKNVYFADADDLIHYDIIKYLVQNNEISITDSKQSGSHYDLSLENFLAVFYDPDSGSVIIGESYSSLFLDILYSRISKLKELGNNLDEKYLYSVEQYEAERINEKPTVDVFYTRDYIFHYLNLYKEILKNKTGLNLKFESQREYWVDF